MSDSKSKRQKVAEELVSYASSMKTEGGGRFFNGPVNGYMGKSKGKNGGKYHSVVLMVSRLLDAEIRVYSPSWILFLGEGPLFNGKRKFDSPDEVKTFLDSKFKDER